MCFSEEVKPDVSQNLIVEENDRKRQSKFHQYKCIQTQGSTYQFPSLCLVVDFSPLLLKLEDIGWLLLAAVLEPPRY